MKKRDEPTCIIHFAIHQTAFDYFLIDRDIALRIRINRYRITCFRKKCSYKIEISDKK